MSRNAWLVPAVLLLASCRSDTVITTGDPEVVVLNPQMWAGGPLRLVSQAFSAGLPLVVTVDDAVLPDADIAGAGTDTLTVSGYWGLGWHTVAVRIGERRPPALRFEVHGFDVHGWAGAIGTEVPVRLTGRPLAVGDGSSKFWVGTSQGLAILDASSPATAPQVVDSAVDVSCLWSITPAPGGAVVTADRGCGTLRARRYGTVTVEVDSGPQSAGWHHAVHGSPGVWLLVGGDSVGVAVRQDDGSWAWSFYHWSADAQRVRFSSEDYPPEVSPDGRLAVAARLRSDWRRADLLVFDLETGSLLYRQDAAPGPAVAFSPSSDTMVAFENSALVLLDSRTGRRLAAYPDSVYGLYGTPWGPLVWDPYAPWLYAWSPHGCPAFLVVDRRTWSQVGGTGWGSDIPECDGAIAVSGFTRTGWALELDFQGEYPYLVASFTIADP